jgi:hypothetical protein
MTVATTLARVAYTGDGVTVAFAVPFPFFDPADLVVVERTIASGAEVTKTLNVDYTVAGGAGSTGTVTASVAPAGTKQWIVLRSTPLTQLIDYVSNDGFPAETHEAGLDRGAMRDQEVQEKLSRTLSFPVGDPSGVDPTLPNSVDRAGKVLGFDVNGAPVPVVEIPAGSLNLPMAIADGGTGATDAGGARTALSAAGVADANIFTATQTVRSSDAGAAVGPEFALDRASASPAASDVLGAVRFDGKDSAGNTETYARVEAGIVDATNGSEDGILAWLTKIGGSLARRFLVGSGLYDSAATGGDKGAGTINLSGGYYVNNVLLAPGAVAGQVVQRTHLPLTSVVAVAADIPIDDTVPQNTEGTQVLSHAHTPLAVGNKLLVRVNLTLTTGGGSPTVAAALFRSGSASAIAATLVDGPAQTSVTFEAEYTVVTNLNPITFTVRVGHGGGTCVVNGDASSNRFFGAITKSSITVEELKV